MDDRDGLTVGRIRLGYVGVGTSNVGWRVLGDVHLLGGPGGFGVLMGVRTVMG
jgi:hypothetical protein